LSTIEKFFLLCNIVRRNRPMRNAKTKLALIAAGALGLVAAMGVGFSVGRKTAAPQPVEPPMREPNISGQWSIHRGKAVDTLTMRDESGILTGEIKQDPDWGAQTGPVHGVRVGQNVQWSYEMKSTGSSPMDLLTANYTMNGSLTADGMAGPFTVTGAMLAEQSANETNFWIARRK
jgi:hypothetical protein